MERDVRRTRQIEQAGVYGSLRAVRAGRPRSINTLSGSRLAPLSASASSTAMRTATPMRTCFDEETRIVRDRAIDFDATVHHRITIARLVWRDGVCLRQAVELKNSRVRKNRRSCAGWTRSIILQSRRACRETLAPHFSCGANVGGPMTQSAPSSVRARR